MTTWDNGGRLESGPQRDDIELTVIEEHGGHRRPLDFKKDL